MTSHVARRVAWWLTVLALVGATLAASALGAWEIRVKSQHKPPVADQLADRQAATEAASTGTVKLLSYSYQTLDQDFDAASALLTGDFLNYYRQFTSQTVKPAALQKRMTIRAAVVRAGIETLTDQKAAVLVFVNQTTTSEDPPSQQPSTSASSVKVGLRKVHGSWLVESFDPV